MLTLPEKILFVLAVVASLYVTYHTFGRMLKIVNRGQGNLSLDNLPRLLMTGAQVFLTQRPVYKTRLTASIFHAGIAVAFIFYLLVNGTDVLGGFSAGFHHFLSSSIMGPYRLIADVLSISALVGMSYFLLRRFVFNSPILKHRENVKLHPKAADGIRRDSLIVGIFILLHIGFRFIGESFLVAAEGHADAWQPFASILANAWGGMSPTGQIVGWHISWWIALGLIIAFLPYFPYTKHSHLFAGPLNFATRPERKALGALDALDFEDEEAEKFGVTSLTDLDQTLLVDAFACIMCNRCQDVCPAYVTGKELSPSALEINKRYGIKEHFNLLADGEDDPLVMLDFAISESAVWACTSCGACSEICPVGNEPFIDIMGIRRSQVLMESEFPNELQNAFRGMERNGNPWQMAEDRLSWAQPLDFAVPTIEQNPEFDVLYWVGCAAAFDPRAQETARALVTVLHHANINFAVLGNQEGCTGDVARRAGNEYLFYEMANMNVETLNEVKPKKIITACPHCLHTIKAEYPAFGGNFDVVHHTQFINDLVGSGQIKLDSSKMMDATFHDPCYLGRHNGVYEAPRDALSEAGAKLLEMERSKEGSFCCGAGGAQFWKEEEEGEEAVNINRYEEAKATGAKTLAVGCPFCTRMLTDADAQEGGEMDVRDVAEIVADALV
ncbi:MAG: (Fe-S)-binding protein [Chloroflexota bacterium]